MYALLYRYKPAQNLARQTTDCLERSRHQRRQMGNEIQQLEKVVYDAVATGLFSYVKTCRRREGEFYRVYFPQTLWAQDARVPSIVQNTRDAVTSVSTQKIGEPLSHFLVGRVVPDR